MTKPIEHHFSLSASDGTLSKHEQRRWPDSARKTGLTGIYVLISGRKVIRFGETATGLRRVKRGFSQRLKHRETKKKNYYAYAFRKCYKGRLLSVRFYTSESVELADAKCRRRVEAELAYRFRRYSEADLWPEAMTEIHFSNDLTRDEQRFADHIADDIGLGSPRTQ